MTKEAFNEIQVLQSCAAGDTAAFGAIVQKYQSLVCAITYSAVGQVDKSEELAQQAFINAWQNLAQLKDLDMFKAWLIAITRNVIRTFFRTQKRDIVNNAAAIDRIDDVADGSSEPLETMITKEQEATVQQYLQQIPEMYREPMVLFYRQQQSVREVAEALDLSEDTVRTRLMRGRKMLKEQVTAMVESTLSHTGPGKAFTTMVVASIAGLALTSATASAATAASSAGTAATSAGSSGLAALTTGIMANILTAAAVVAVSVGAVFVYKHLSNPESVPTKPEDVAMVQDKQEPVLLPENTDTVQTEVSDVIAADSIEKSETQIAALPNNLTITDVPEIKPVSISQITGIPENTDDIFEPNGILSGIITDAESGQPVTDATVTISPGRLYRAKTDDRGYYSFETIEKTGDYSIGIYSKEYVGLMDSSVQPKIHLKKNEQHTQHFQLAKACMIDLYVVDEQGNPVKDARVWMTSLAEEHGREIGPSFLSQRTDEEGYILLGGFPPSDKPYVITSMHTTEGGWVEMYGQKVREQVPEFAPGHLKVTPQDPDIIESGEIVLRKGIRLQGTAKYADGTPAKECKIVPYPDWWHSTSSPPDFAIDPNGTFTLDHIVPGTYRIQARIPRGRSSAIGMGLFRAKLPSEKDKLLDVTIPRKPTTEDTVNEVVEAKLSGLVIDAVTGKPIPEFRLRYKRISSSYYTSDGKWTQFKNPKGDFTLDVIGNQHAVCKVQAVAEGYAPQWSEEINTQDNRAMLIKLTAGGSITGTVVDVDGKPVADARVLPYSLAGTERDTSEPIFVSEEGAVATDQAGLFTLNHIAPGFEMVQISHPDFTYTRVPNIEVKQAQQTDLGKIALHQGGIIEGVVYDHQGKPQSDVTLYAQNHYGYSSSEIRYATAMTDPNGTFQMERIPSELVYIVRPRAYEQTGVVSRAVIPAENAVTRLDFGGGPVIEGQIIIDGQALKNNRLMLTLGQSSGDGLFRSHTDTDDNGRFKIPAGLPGTYTLTYNQKSEQFTSNPIKLLNIVVASNDIDCGIIPGNQQILNAQILASDEQFESIRFFYLRQDDPLEGPCVFWKDHPEQNQMPYSIRIPEPGLYYAVIRHGVSWKEYRYPIEIKEDQERLDIQIPFQPGPVTISGKLPERISHVWFTNQEQSISGLLYNNKKNGGVFGIDGLLPGIYYFSPKWGNHDDSIEMSIPNVSEFPLTLDLALLQNLLKERVSVRVFDQYGLPVENATVWVEGDKMSLLPAVRDHCSRVFYLPDGDYVIHAQKEGSAATRAYRVTIDKNNTASGESYETYIQLK